MSTNLGECAYIGKRRGDGGMNSSLILLVVLFILLVIIGIICL
ncbi:MULTISPECIES: YjcZ family sporulation protein [Bacillus]|uniref:YjcZ family sporulation protein n=1 Tax=Bacillus pseudomycoides TaxID=64104 RepID=A0AAJ1Z9M4_9BACI|nr:YjcZ family sporulation protein [Bacillus pseudomycoides]MDR4328896.1 YjcZ family sporulation protein [Bacillus pseudomycoides]